MLNERLSSSDESSGDNGFSSKSQKRTKIRKRNKGIKSVKTPCNDNDERIIVENNEVKILCHTDLKPTIQLSVNNEVVKYSVDSGSVNQ